MVGSGAERLATGTNTTLEFFFDCSSPWTYLAFEGVQPLAAELGVAIDWRPILVGGIFNTINPTVYASRERPVREKQRYMLKDLHDWAREAGLAIRFPPSIFPANSVKAMRACIALAPQGALVPFAREVFRIYWGEDRDIAQDDVLREVCRRAGVDDAFVLDAVTQPRIKDALKANTDEVMTRGGFGSPTMFVDRDDMYFGNDRLPLVRAALLRRRAPAR